MLKINLFDNKAIDNDSEIVIDNKKNNSNSNSNSSNKKFQKNYPSLNIKI